MTISIAIEKPLGRDQLQLSYNSVGVGRKSVTHIHNDLIDESLGQSELLDLSPVNFDEIVTANYVLRYFNVNSI